MEQGRIWGATQFQGGEIEKSLMLHRKIYILHGLIYKEKKVSPNLWKFANPDCSLPLPYEQSIPPMSTEGGGGNLPSQILSRIRACMGICMYLFYKQICREQVHIENYVSIIYYRPVLFTNIGCFCCNFFVSCPILKSCTTFWHILRNTLYSDGRPIQFTVSYKWEDVLSQPLN